MFCDSTDPKESFSTCDLAIEKSTSDSTQSSSTMEEPIEAAGISLAIVRQLVIEFLSSSETSLAAPDPSAGTRYHSAIWVPGVSVLSQAFGEVDDCSCCVLSDISASVSTCYDQYDQKIDV